MITIHVSGTILNTCFADSFIEHECFDFDGKNDAETESAIREYFFALKAKGAVNVNCVSEDSLVSDDSPMPHLRWGHAYMYGSGGNTKAYVADYTPDELSRHWC